LPIWTSEDKTEQLCIGSVEELHAEIEKAVKAGFMTSNPLANKADYDSFDLHRPYADEITLVSASGKKMSREADLIDVWFDSGAMPYAQWHYPFENIEEFEKSFPADFIAEGVDQTRGWFFTLHAIAVLLFDSVAFKNVVSNGLVLDKNGNKMSKRLGNAADPFETLAKYGADATRWYMISNAQPWDNLKFNLDGITEVQRKFFGTLYNTYAFYALYANIDVFVADGQNTIPVQQRPEIDRWIISCLQQLILDVDACYADYDPTRAARLVQDFVNDNLSNWYVRLCRRRFWKGEMSADKQAAYETLHECLVTVSQLMSPIAPFFADWLYKSLTDCIREQGKALNTRFAPESIHLTDFVQADKALIDVQLMENMALAQSISSMVLALRKKVNIRVRQPLNKILIPALDETLKHKLDAVKEMILSEVNVKEIEYITDTAGVLVKKIRPNFKVLGKKVGAKMKDVAANIETFTQQDIAIIESTGQFPIQLGAESYTLTLEDVEVLSEDIPGWQVATEGKLTVALDINITPMLREEGIARELINRIQNLRKDNAFDVTDKIAARIKRHDSINAAVSNNLRYICAEILATSLELVPEMNAGEGVLVDVDDNIQTFIAINKLN
jgi:isoleucyl-tRNA synthetase